MAQQTKGAVVITERVVKAPCSQIIKSYRLLGVVPNLDGRDMHGEHCMSIAKPYVYKDRYLAYYPTQKEKQRFIDTYFQGYRILDEWDLKRPRQYV